MRRSWPMSFSPTRSTSRAPRARRSVRAGVQAGPGHSALTQRGDDLALGARDCGAARWAGRWKNELAFVAGALFDEHLYDLGDDFAGFTNDDRVADADILAAHFELVVERGFGDGSAGDFDRFEDGEGRERASAADVDADIEHARARFFRRELEGAGPPRIAANKAKLALHRERIDFDDDAVGGVIDFGAFGFPVVDEGARLFETVADYPLPSQGLTRKPAAARTAKTFSQWVLQPSPSFSPTV